MSVTSAVCKFMVTSVDGPNVRMSAQYDENAPEDRHFTEATPWGEMEFGVNNPQLAGFFREGRQYYVTITPAG